jgi:hypothetical protein
VGFRLCLLRKLQVNSKFNRLEKPGQRKNAVPSFFLEKEIRLRCRPRHMLHSIGCRRGHTNVIFGLGELMPFFLCIFHAQRGLKGKIMKRDGKGKKGGRRRPSHGEAQGWSTRGAALMRITTCETRTQLIVYSVSLSAACFYFLCCIRCCAALFCSQFFSLVSFQRAVLKARSTMPMLPPCYQVGPIA